MTPDIHTKTYAERSGLGGIASGMGAIGNGISGGTASLHNGANNPQYTNIHQSAKNKNHQLMALTIGGSGINSSMFAGVPSANNGGSNLGMY